MPLRGAARIDCHIGRAPGWTSFGGGGGGSRPRLGGRRGGGRAGLGGDGGGTAGRRNVGFLGVLIFFLPSTGRKKNGTCFAFTDNGHKN